MPGFANVSYMTNRQIQRLGHADDATPKYRARTNTKKVVFNFNADDVWSAACQAQRINGTYVKEGQTSELNPDVICKTNRQITFELLEDLAQITDENREQGKKVRQYYQAYTFKILKGIKLGDFDNNAMLLSNRDVINSNYDMAVVVSLPASYERGVKRSDVDQRVKFATGGYIGKPTDKITVTIELLKTVYSQKWNTNYFTGITTDDQIVFFAYNGNGKLDIGDTYTIQGTVKSHRDNSTQLNRVKFI
jgi:hypothetical protein